MNNRLKWPKLVIWRGLNLEVYTSYYVHGAEVFYFLLPSLASARSSMGIAVATN